MTLDENGFYIKIVAHNAIYNLIVSRFSIWDR